MVRSGKDPLTGKNDLKGDIRDRVQLKNFKDQQIKREGNSRSRE